MHLRVAIHATLALPQSRGILARSKRIHGSANGSHAACNVRSVALLAQHGRARFEHALHDAAVRVVAIGAVFSHWIVLMDKGAALFSMAGVASGVGAVTRHELGAC